MVIFFGIILMILLFFLYAAPKQSRANKDSKKAAGNPHRKKANEFEERPEREIALWEKPLSRDELIRTQRYIATELSKMGSTDWGHYALSALCTKSAAISKFMTGDALDINFIKTSEKNGIKDALDAIKYMNLRGVTTLRSYFHKMFEEIYKRTSYSGGNKFYWYGRDRVIGMLRSYQASHQRFIPSQTKFYDVDGEEFNLNTRIDAATIKRIREALVQFKDQVDRQKPKKKYRFPILSENPIIEFNLERIKTIGVLKYKGSLVNSLYIELKTMLNLSNECEYEGIWAISEPYYDAEASHFTFVFGHIMVAKFRGAVDYFADRLYVEFFDIKPDSWIIRWVKSYKLHLEGND